MPTPSRNSKVATALYAAVAAFLTYTMIFGFRKTFTVGTFAHQEYWGMAFKTLIVVSQVFGYLAAKFYGIKFIAELRRRSRWKIILQLCGVSWLAWLLFACTPAPFNLIFAAANGFPLGLLWGVVFSYIEGRRSTDFLGAALAVSFIFSSGFVKTVGSWLMLRGGIAEKWVPFTACLVFAGPLLLFVWMMEKIPPPTPEDEKERMLRKPLLKEERKQLIRQFRPGLVMAILIYLLATCFRDIRDNFSADMWTELGYNSKPEIFTLTEIPVTIFILIVISSLTLLRNNKTAFTFAHLIIAIGFIVCGGASFLFAQQLMHPFVWMPLTGIGLYMVYIPYNSVYFERMIATFSITGNVGFLIYLADSIGYLGSVSVLLAKELLELKTEWVSFFSTSTIYLSGVGLALTVLTYGYFKSKWGRMAFSPGDYKRSENNQQPVEP